MQNPGVSDFGSNIVSTKTPLIGLTPTFAVIGTSSTPVLSANSARKGCVFVNVSSNYISFGIASNNAVLYSGITLAPNGVWDMSEYDYVTSAINAIASASGSQLSIQEFQ